VTEQPQQLNPAVPADAAEIIGRLVGRLRMDGLSGADVAVLIRSIDTVRQAVAPKAEA